MTMEPSNEYVRRCLELADEFFSDATLSLEHSKLRSAINNVYYAMFHAAQAVLTSKGIKPPITHKGLRFVFGREIIMGGLLEKRIGRALNNAFEMRQAGTYDVYASFKEEDVKEIVDEAELFIKTIKKILKEVLDPE